MSPVLPLIEEAIDVPMMDVKNVAKIIDDYVKYDVRDFNSFQEIVMLEFLDFRLMSSFEQSIYYFVKSTVNEEIIYEFFENHDWKNLEFDEEGKLTKSNEFDKRAIHIEKYNSNYVFLPSYSNARFFQSKEYDLFYKKKISKEQLLKTYENILKSLNTKLKYINQEQQPGCFKMEYNGIEIAHISVKGPDTDNDEDDDEEEDNYHEFYSLYKNLLNDILQ